MLDTQKSAPKSASPAAADTDELIDPTATAAELRELAKAYDGRERELRTAVAQRLKARLTEGRARAEALLLKDRHGRRCAERLCQMQDEIIRILFDFASTVLYPPQVRSEAERMTVVATGGYGRGLLAPGSDIDLLFLLPYKQTAWSESVAEALLYCLWDMGLKVGHASRSVSECIRQAKADMTIRTSLLESRYLLGDKKLYDELTSRFDKEIAQGSAPEFVAAKLAEREERHRRAGQSRYLVEPNVKDGKGGLRDLHTLFWIAKYVYRVREPEGLIARGVFDRDEFKLFRRCEDFLWSVRCNMHFLAGRAEERLSFDIQRDIAVRLGYTAHPGLRDVERFMKHYFLIAKDVGDLTAILCAGLEERQAKPAPVLSRLTAWRSTWRAAPARKKLSESDDFVVDNNRINIARADVFRRDPVNLIRIFHLAQKHNLAFHPEAMRVATHSLKLIDKDVRDDKEANRLFLEILTSKNATEIVLRRMNEAGVLGAFVHSFGRIVAMMQFNMYHHYTVDEHLIRCIGVLNEIERGENPEFALANELIKTIQPQHRTVLYVALFLHDIAKGRVEDHSIAGARLARRLAPRLGLNAADTELVAWLVEVHLVMSTVAQSRDLSDRKTIENFAAVVQSLERLKLLTILTTADIRAVGPGCLERLEGAITPHALLRDRAGAHRRLFRGQPRPARRHGAGRIPRPVQGLAGACARRLYRAALSGLLAQSRPAAQSGPCPLRARHRISRQNRWRPASASTRRAASPSSRCSRRIIRGCSRSSPAPVRLPAPISSTPRSTPRPTGSRSTPSRCRANSSTTRTKAAAPRASATRSRRRCAANSNCPTWWRSARRPRAASRPSPSSPKSPSITNGRTATPWSKSPASTGRACSTS